MRATERRYQVGIRGLNAGEESIIDKTKPDIIIVLEKGIIQEIAAKDESLRIAIVNRDAGRVQMFELDVGDSSVPEGAILIMDGKGYRARK